MTAAASSDRPGRAAGWVLPVTAVRYVDGPRADALAALGIHTVEDLLRHYPSRYLDLSVTAPLASLAIGVEATAVGTVHEITVRRPRPRLSVTEVAITDDSGVLIGVWFNQSYIAPRFRAGERVAFAGRVMLEYGLRQMRNPFVEKLGEASASSWLSRILPIHPATESLSTNWIRRLISEALDGFADVPDHLPAMLRISRGLPPLSTALRWIHFPPGAEEKDSARARLAYDELLAVQLGMALRRHHLVEERTGTAHDVHGRARRALIDALPFRLTDEQVAAVDEISADMASARPMNRLLLGDVGTGKTVVAAIALATAADSGSQAAMMAPTEVLAGQYATSVGPLLDAAGIKWALLTGSTPSARRAEIVAGCADGSILVAMGTHALLTSEVLFERLTLAVVDEQHRFGVTQRLGLRGKGEAADLLVMTATPIPRSLALTLYGDLDASYLHLRPGDRGSDHVATRIVNKAGRAEAYETVRSEISHGRQAYIICALVDESDATEAKAAVKEAQRLQAEVFPDLKVDLLTGQMRTADKASVMESYRRGDTQVLVATTVVEVGVDVPNATVMIVEDAERFGLAQLHQLRGRIGRGEHPGTFLLFADPRTDEGRRRMQAIASTNDGFKLAEEDLRLRGEGQVLGQRQHGLPELRIASVLGDAALLDDARADAARIVAEDPGLRLPAHARLLAHARHVFGREWQWVSSG